MCPLFIFTKGQEAAGGQWAGGHVTTATCLCLNTAPVITMIIITAVTRNQTRYQDILHRSRAGDTRKLITMLMRPLMMLGIVEVTTDNREEESGTVNFYNHRDNDGGLCICTNPASNRE